MAAPLGKSPSAIGYWIAGVIIVVGAVAALVWFVSGVSNLFSEVDTYPRFSVPGQVTTAGGRRYKVFAEYPGASGDVNGVFRVGDVTVVDSSGSRSRCARRSPRRPTTGTTTKAAPSPSSPRRRRGLHRRGHGAPHPVVDLGAGGGRSRPATVGHRPAVRGGRSGRGGRAGRHRADRGHRGATGTGQASSLPDAGLRRSGSGWLPGWTGRTGRVRPVGAPPQSGSLAAPPGLGAPVPPPTGQPGQPHQPQQPYPTYPPGGANPSCPPVRSAAGTGVTDRAGVPAAGGSGEPTDRAAGLGHRSRSARPTWTRRPARLGQSAGR